MRPIRDNVLIKPFASQEKSDGGIIVPIELQPPSNKGVVVETGIGIKDKPMRFKKGDTVYRVKSWGQEVIIDGELHFLMSQDALIAKE